jgi:hypothetical protein
MELNLSASRTGSIAFNPLGYFANTKSCAPKTGGSIMCISIHIPPPLLLVTLLLLLVSLLLRQGELPAGRGVGSL